MVLLVTTAIVQKTNHVTVAPHWIVSFTEIDLKNVIYKMWAILINSLRPSDAYIWVNNLAIIGLHNGLSPGRRQAIIWINAGILLIGPLETNFGEILNEIVTFPFKKMRLNVSSAKWMPFFSASMC